MGMRGHGLCGTTGLQEKWMEEDVRDAFLRQKTTGEFTAAYNATQPVTQFREPTPESDEENK